MKKQTDWKMIWKYDNYYLWECQIKDGRYLYNVTKTSNKPKSKSGYFGVYALLRLKNIPIYDPEIRKQIAEVSEK